MPKGAQSSTAKTVGTPGCLLGSLLQGGTGAACRRCVAERNDPGLAEDKFWRASSLSDIPQACRLLLPQSRVLCWSLSGWRVEVPGSYCAWAHFLFPRMGVSNQYREYMSVLNAAGFLAMVDTCRVDDWPLAPAAAMWAVGSLHPCPGTCSASLEQH